MKKRLQLAIAILSIGTIAVAFQTWVWLPDGGLRVTSEGSSELGRAYSKGNLTWIVVSPSSEFLWNRESQQVYALNKGEGHALLGLMIPTPGNPSGVQLDTDKTEFGKVISASATELHFHDLRGKIVNVGSSQPPGREPGE
jgi:hypothetical protein